MLYDWYPLVFDPVYKDYIWGGDGLKKFYGRAGTPPRCAESWECSSRPEGMSIVGAGPLKGRSLAELARAGGPAFLGNTFRPGRDFPLLVKIIDAREDLSIQVHPDGAGAAAYGGEPKTEAWYVLAAEPESRLIHGFADGVTPERFSRTARNSPESIPELLRRIRVGAGDLVFVPGGTVHAIGAGIMALEIQQNSDTTYRLHDWNRVDSNSRARELHIDQGLRVIDWKRAGAETAVPAIAGTEAAGGFRIMLRCDHFTIEEAVIAGEVAQENDGAGFHGLFGVDGGFTVAGGAGAAVVAAGGAALLPAAISRYCIRPSGEDTHGRGVRIVRFRP